MVQLYDLVAANDVRFSPFCARTKAALKHKNVPYSTVPIRFCDKDKLAFSGQTRVPVLRDNGTVVSDSWKIAEYLDERYPSQALFPGPGLKEACRFFNLYVDETLHPALVPVVVYDIFQRIEPIDRDYFRSSREKRFGTTLEDLHAKRSDYRPRLQAVLANLDATVTGQEYLFGAFTYADVCLFGTLTWVTRASDERLLETTPALAGWWERMQERFQI